MNKGFTLVELSIVLVIIGLLIGGILVGQSLINSSKLNALVQQLQQYDAATRLFKDKYKTLPGENNTAFNVRYYGTTSPAAKDGVLTDDDKQMNTTYYGTGGSEEYLLFYKDLAAMSGLKFKNCPSMDSAISGNTNLPALTGTNCNVAKAEYGDSKNIMIVPTAYRLNIPNQGNAYVLLDCSSQTGVSWTCTSALSQLDTMTYDAKVDDGLPSAGSVRGYTNVTRPYPQAMTWPSAYDLSSSAPSMALIQRFANGL